MIPSTEIQDDKINTEELRKQYLNSVKIMKCRRGSCEIGELRKRFPRQRFSKVKANLIFLSDRSYIPKE